MAEYLTIDAAYDDATLTDWYISSVDDDSAPVWTDEHIYELLSDFYVIPKDTPAADVAPVKHGHWVYKERTKLSSTGVARITEEGEAYVVKNRITVRVPYCSECGDHGDNVVDATPYCPNCGARMDGGDDNASKTTY